MFNPFTEVIGGDSDEVALAEAAKGGSREALEQLILRHQAWVYNIAVRMVFHPQDAEEVTQEVLVKDVTRLGSFRGDSRFRTWLYRITANHVLNMKRRGAELRPQTFGSYAAALDDPPDLDLPDPRSVPVDVPLLVEEAKVACTAGMLLCLDRRQRLVFTLGEILGVSDTVGGDILELSADNFRQCLARARRDLYQFMHGRCGLVNTENPCRCPKKTRGFIAAGHVDPERLLFVPLHVRRVREAAPDTVRAVEGVLDRRYADIYRDHPFLQPSSSMNAPTGVRIMRYVLLALTLVAVGGTALAQHPGHGRVKVAELSRRDIVEKLGGKDAQAAVKEVTFEPGQQDTPHRHAGPVFGYVLEGTYEHAIDDEPVKTYRAGDTFYEPTGALHRVARNPSGTARTRLLAVILYPRDATAATIPAAK